MNMRSEDRLKVNLAAQEGDINRLYTVIQENPHVLEDIDSIPFTDTPLHVAASVGHVPFAIEIMRLKPSFAWKRNPQGFTSIHLALQNGHDRMVRHLIFINKDLVRAKGREGCTPLHFATEKGKIDLLIRFLRGCPESIEDVTIRNESALHIAVRCGQYEAFQVLLGWLMRTSQRGAIQLEMRILNWTDEQGNTILHVSSSENNLQMVQLLVKTKVDLKAKNFEERSALDIATNEEIRSILIRAKANVSVTDVDTFADILKSKMTWVDRIITFILRIRNNTTEEQRNAYLIIVTLVTTAMYQSTLSPPGGVYQANAEDNSANTTISLNSTTTFPNSTATATQGHEAGTSVLSQVDFIFLSSTNLLSFLVSAAIIYILSPSGDISALLVLPISLLTYSYLYSTILISPSIGMQLTIYILWTLFAFVNFFLCIRLLRTYRVGGNR